MDDRSAAADEVAEAVRAVFRAGERRDFAALRAFHAEDASFSRWSNRPGGALLNVAGAPTCPPEAPPEQAVETVPRPEGAYLDTEQPYRVLP